MVVGNNNQVPVGQTKKPGVAPACGYSSDPVLLNRLRMRASFNPTLMSSSLEEAEMKVKDILGSSHFVRTRPLSGGSLPVPRMNAATFFGSQYFQQANFQASRELLKSGDLSIGRMCFPRQFTSNMEAPNSTSAIPSDLESPALPRNRRALDDVAKVAEIDQIGTPKRQYCLTRGDEKNGLLRLCKMCAVVTELPETYFPRYINEVMCSSEDTGCLYAGKLPHGVCQAKKLEITILERYTNHECVEDWQPVTVEVRVSCECFVHKSSFLRPFA